MGSMLLARGLRLGECLESLNLTHPDWVGEITAMYVEAGADLVQTNTFGGSPLKLAASGLEADTEALNARGVEIARMAAGDRAYVLGSCGPCGRLLEPYGNTNRDDVRAAFRRQFRALAGPGLDGILIETMTNLAEALIALEAAREVVQVPVLVTLTFNDTPRGFCTIMGNPIRECVRELQAAGADAIGSNCGSGVANMTRVAEEFRRFTDMPLIMQSNAGLPETVDGKLAYRESPESFAAEARALLALGVSIVGGCCGTTPEHIRAIRAVVGRRATDGLERS
jgi:5-methyltetrahydrofolate--homocysteine methyltransferase